MSCKIFRAFPERFRDMVILRFHFRESLGGDAVSWSVRLARGRLCVQIQTATDLNRLTGNGRSPVKFLATGECHAYGFSEMTIIHVNGCSVSQ